MSAAMSAPNKQAGARTQRAQGTQRAQDKRSGQEPVAPNRVAEIQRQRIIGAMAEVAAEKGAANVTVAHIVARAGISRRTFYEIFEDREACLLAALEEAIGQAASAVVPAYRGQERWRERIRAGLAALLAFLDEEPGLGRLCVVEALGAGDRALERRAQCLAALIAAVDEGRGEAPGGRQPPPMTAEGIVGAVFSIVHARILVREGMGGRGAAPLTALLGELMGVIVLPYLGQAAAQKELHKPAPPLPPTKTRPRRDPLEGLDMRLTYRTVRVLMGIAGHPGASNRTVAEASGISDQGQISKLLARLDSLGLVRNTGQGHPKGAPNAWQLTARGQEVEQAIRLQTGPRGGRERTGV
ncbi:MAG TPA: TetR family transcriptional regulator [Solirubrobacteraceae bacterium]|jgi:AcrR family transcriptional regulator